MIHSPEKLFSALSKKLRLRLLRAVDQAELSVAELTEALGLPQSTVSRQLAPLRDLGLVDTRREGTWVFYSKGRLMEHLDVYPLLQESFASIDKQESDKACVQRVIDQRRRKSQAFFDTRAGQYSQGIEPGGSFQALTMAFAFGFEGRDIVDLGCGEGALAFTLAEAGANVLAIDSSAKMLDFVRSKSRYLDIDSILALQADLESLPVASQSADLVLISQSLHHVAQPELAIQESSRILRKGGRLIILDLVRHDNENLRQELGDHWLGFDPKYLNASMKKAGLSTIEHRSIAMNKQPAVLLVSGKK